MMKQGFRKRVLAALAFCMMLGVVLCMQTEASAAVPKGVKVTYNGKSITFNREITWKGDQPVVKLHSEPKTLKDVEKKWGKKTRLAKDGEEYAGEAYVWKKGKTFISVRQDPGGKYLGYVYVESKDKNAAVAGVKVGMKKETAVKKLQKLYGKDAVMADKGKKGVITSGGDWGMLEITFKNGRISGIVWMRS